MTTLGGLWDGEEHQLDPADGYFPETGASLVLDGWDEDEEEDVLSPFESPTLIPRLRDTRTAKDDPRFPNARLEQAWGSLSVVLTALSRVLESPKKQYENINHKANTVTWSFQAEEPLTERL
jgi:hypothetical protein